MSLVSTLSSRDLSVWGQSGANGIWRNQADPDRPPGTAASLPNGKVLIVQTGAYPRLPLPDSEEVPVAGFYAQVYDPLGGDGNGSWKEAAKPIHVQGWAERYAFTLTENCLPNCGKVLVRLGGHPATWKVYDAAADVWVEAVPVFSRNHGMTAGMIKGTIDQCGVRCGMVISAGGGETGPPEDQGPVTAELFDPKSGSWSLTMPPPGERWNGTTASLGDGRVLFMYPPLWPSPDAVGEFYDGLSGQWSPAAPPPANIVIREAGTAFPDPVVLDDGRVLVFTHERRASLFDPKAGPQGAWSDAPQCTVCGGTATKLPSGKVLIAGGSDNSLTDRAELFDPTANGGRGQFIPTANLKVAGGRYTATLVQGPFAGLLGAGCGSKCGSVLISGGSDWESPWKSGLPTELYTPGPEIHSIEPNVGPAAGGTVVEITGSGLSAVSEVKFGARTSAKIEPDPEQPDSKVRVTTPPHPAGVVPVNLRTMGELAPALRPDAFKYLDAGGGPDPPVIPKSGPSAPPDQPPASPPVPPGAAVSGPTAGGGGAGNLGVPGSSSLSGGAPSLSGPPAPPPPGGSVSPSVVSSAMAVLDPPPAPTAVGQASPLVMPDTGSSTAIAASPAVEPADSAEPAPRFGMVGREMPGIALAVLSALLAAGLVGLTRQGGRQAAFCFQDAAPQVQIA